MCVEIMNSRRQGKGKLGINSRLPFDINVMLNLSISFEMKRLLQNFHIVLFTSKNFTIRNQIQSLAFWGFFSFFSPAVRDCSQSHKTTAKVQRLQHYRYKSKQRSKRLRRRFSSEVRSALFNRYAYLKHTSQIQTPSLAFFSC